MFCFETVISAFAFYQSPRKTISFLAVFRHISSFTCVYVAPVDFERSNGK